MSWWYFNKNEPLAKKRRFRLLSNLGMAEKVMKHTRAFYPISGKNIMLVLVRMYIGIYLDTQNVIFYFIFYSTQNRFSKLLTLSHTQESILVARFSSSNSEFRATLFTAWVSEDPSATNEHS